MRWIRPSVGGAGSLILSAALIIGGALGPRILLALGALLGVIGVVWLVYSLRHEATHPAQTTPPPVAPQGGRVGLVREDEHSTTTKWEDGSQDVTVRPPAAHAVGVGRPAAVNLVARLVDLANRVHACAPGGYQDGPYEMPSAYGLKQNMTNWVAAHVRGEHIAEEQGQMTDELWREVRGGIEELGHAGYRSHLLEPYLSRKPEPSECGTVGAEIYYQTSKMVEATPRPPDPRRDQAP